MKRILVIMLAFSVLNAKAQDIPKKTNTIIIKGVGFIEAANKLLDSGYTINKKDNELQTLETDPKATKKLNGVIVKYFVRIKDSSMVLYGMVALTGGMLSNDAHFNRIYYGGMSNSPLKVSWQEMNAFALSFNKPVEYLIQ